MRRLSGPKITVQENCNKTFLVFVFRNTIKRTHPSRQLMILYSGY